MRPDVIVGTLFVIIGLGAVFVLIPIGVNEPANVQYRALAPSYWPRIICLTIAVLGAAMIARSFLAMKNDTEVASQQGEPIPERTFWRAGLVIAGGFALYAVLEWLGFVLATTIALFALMLLAGERRVHFLVPVALGVPLALYFFFTKAASIPIPSGILESILVGG